MTRRPARTIMCLNCSWALWMSLCVPALLRGCSLPFLAPCCLYAQTHHTMTSARTCPPVMLRIRDVECHELPVKLSLACLVGSLAIWWNSEVRIASTSRLKTPLATHSFGLRPGPFTLVALLLYELKLLKGSKCSSASHSTS